jgi:hypothetical protein
LIRKQSEAGSEADGFPPFSLISNRKAGFGLPSLVVESRRGRAGSRVPIFYRGEEV